LAGIIGEIGDFKKFNPQQEILTLAGLDLYETSFGKGKGREIVPYLRKSACKVHLLSK
jgi:hypothetical protein